MSVLESPRFAFQGTIWQLRMYPNSENENGGERRYHGNDSERKFVSLFLLCHNTVSKQIGWDLSIENLKDKEKSVRGHRREFCFAEGLSRGYKQFCKTQSLLKPENGFLDESGGITVTTALDLSLNPKSDHIPCDDINNLNRVFTEIVSKDKDEKKHGALPLKQISNFRKDDLHTDFEIKGKGYSIRVHKVIVSSCSGFFEAMLNPQFRWRENAEQSVYLKSIDERTMRAVVAFMYGEEDFLERVCTDERPDEKKFPRLEHGRTDAKKPRPRTKAKPKQKINPLLKLLLAADHLLVSRLVGLCEKRVEQSLTVENVLKVLEAVVPIYAKDVKDIEREIVAAENLERRTSSEPPRSESDLFCAEPKSKSLSLAKDQSLSESLDQSSGPEDQSLDAPDVTRSRKRLRDNDWGRDRSNLIRAVLDFAVAFMDELLRQKGFVEVTTRKPWLSNLLMRKSRLRNDYVGKVFVENNFGSKI